MTTLLSRHLGDDELLRLLDRDDEPDQLVRMEAHARDCQRCTGELHSLAHAAALVHARLPEVDAAPEQGSGEGEARVLPFTAPAGVSGAQDGPGAPPLRRRPAPPSRPLWQRAWLRAAVLVLAAGGALVSVEPLRAHIRDWVAGAWAQVSGRSAPTAAAAPTVAAAPAAPAPAIVEFRTAGRELRVELTSRQAAGALVLERGPGSVAALEVQPADPAVVPLASERLLEIRNRAGSRASYLVRVPAGIERVIVRVAGEDALRVESRALAGGVRIELARP